jgi:electron transport complex protein RnfA
MGAASTMAVMSEGRPTGTGNGGEMEERSLEFMMGIQQIPCHQIFSPPFAPDVRGFGGSSTKPCRICDIDTGKGAPCFGAALHKTVPNPHSMAHEGTSCWCRHPLAWGLQRTHHPSFSSFTPMSELLLLLISTALVNNVVLIKFLGLCPVMGVSKSLESAVGMGMATTFVLTLAAAASWMLEHWLLVPLGLEYLRILTFILVIASVVQFTEMFIRKSSPGLYQSLGIYLPLITTNCAVLGVSLLNVQQGYGLFWSIAYGFGSAVGFTLVLMIFAGLRERIALSRVPAAFSGAPIAFITISLLALAFMGFAGLSV